MKLQEKIRQASNLLAEVIQELNDPEHTVHNLCVGVNIHLMVAMEILEDEEAQEEAEFQGMADRVAAEAQAERDNENQ